jgi:multiple sugar transport system substrate-binding protein
MMKPSRFALFLLLALGLSGCANLPTILATPQPATASAEAPTPALTATSPALPVTVDGPRVLRLWLPAQFNPAAETQAAVIMQSRLDEFLNRRPGLQIEIRIKPDAGTGGLLDGLVVTAAAAPQVLPDLVALSRTDLESAALQGLLHPLDGLTLALDDPDWYPYAFQLAHIQNTIYGIPFAGDGLMLVGYADPLPRKWDELDDGTFLFPAASPQAYVSMALYLSAGGNLINEQGRPMLDEDVMAEVLSFYAKMAAQENLSYTVVSIQDDAAVWQAFKEQRANLVATWTSRYLAEDSIDALLGPLPGLQPTLLVDGEGNFAGSVSLARGYAWALAGSNLENQALAVELAEFLSAGDFLTEWTKAARVLPTRPTVLSSWEDTRLRLELTQVADSAQLIPGNDLTDAIGPLFEKAIAAVLTAEKTPSEAATEAVTQLK